MYVGNNDFEKTKLLLLSNGFELDTKSEDCMHHIGLYKNGIEVELHFNMFDEDVDFSWKRLFSKPFESSELESDSLISFRIHIILFIVLCILQHIYVKEQDFVTF